MFSNEKEFDLCHGETHKVFSAQGLKYLKAGTIPITQEPYAVG